MTKSDFSSALRSLRARARLSQLALAERAMISQRQISFLETGRSNPSRESVLKLAQALKLSPTSTNDLMAAAGYAEAFHAPGWDSDAMAPVRLASAHILESHLPYPAVLLTAAGDVLQANAAFDHALSLLDDPASLWARSHGEKPRNLYRLSLHAEGLMPHMANFPEIARATLQRAAREAAHQPKLAADIKEFLSWPHIDPAWLETGNEAGPVIEERYKVAGAVISVFAVVTTLGAPIDIAMGAVRIESYFPANEPSRRRMAAAV